MIVKDKKKFRAKMRFVCKFIKHKWRPVNKTKLGFRIKDICISCGKVRTVTGKELYIE